MLNDLVQKIVFSQISRQGPINPINQETKKIISSLEECSVATPSTFDKEYRIYSIHILEKRFALPNKC